LKSNDVTVAPDKDSAKAVLVINGERFSRRVLAVAASGKAQEFALQYTVQFSLLNKEGQVLLGQQDVQLERDLRFDENAVLATSSEAERLNQDMVQDAAQQILRRIQAVNPSNISTETQRKN
jgi:LPS-assembly lipoprotein